MCGMAVGTESDRRLAKPFTATVRVRMLYIMAVFFRFLAEQGNFSVPARQVMGYCE